MNTEFENPTFPRLDRKENARICKIKHIWQKMDRNKEGCLGEKDRYKDRE
jgi:hypothetical protein